MRAAKQHRVAFRSNSVAVAADRFGQKMILENALASRDGKHLPERTGALHIFNVTVSMKSTRDA
jgi:hypothetical protein